MKIKFTVNQKDLDKEIKSSMAKRANSAKLRNNLKDKSNKLIYKKFESEKKRMINEFLNLPVTKELMAGPQSRNISGTLGGYGNLFTFIGFEVGAEPVLPIIQLLNKTQIVFNRLSPRGTSKIRIEMPSAKDIFAVTPLPWATGISWAKGIETGMSGLGQYINKPSAFSRSGSGLQTTSRLRSGKFSNMPYVSQFINKWQKEFIKLSK
jgi:hypothetical protein